MSQRAGGEPERQRPQHARRPALRRWGHRDRYCTTLKGERRKGLGPPALLGDVNKRILGRRGYATLLRHGDSEGSVGEGGRRRRILDG